MIMSVYFLVVLSLQWLSTDAAYCQSLVQDCRRDKSDRLADFQEMFVQYQRECDEKEYFQIQSVEKENRIYQYTMFLEWLTKILSPSVCVNFNVCVVKVTVRQAIEGLLLQMCGGDEAYFLSSTNMIAPSTCNYQNDTYIVAKTFQEQEIFLKYIGTSKTTVIRYIILDHQMCSYQGLVKYDKRKVVRQFYNKAKSDELTILRKRRQVTTGLQYLLISSRNIIHQVSLDGTRSHALVSNLVNSIALDYDYRRNKMYWTDVNTDTIMQSNLDGSGIITLLSEGLAVPDGLAVDWITDKLYFTDASLDIVGVFDPVHFFYRVLVQTGSATQPRAIVLDPNTRMMYWSDWGMVARIEKASMDGSNRRVIHNTDLIWPNALTIDYESQTLYWADASLDRIESSGVDGTNRILLTTTGIGHAYGMVFHQNILYMSDWVGSTIDVLNSTGGGVRSLIQLTTCNTVFGIQVVDLERQPMALNPCESRNGGCSHFCLLSTSTARYSCACPDGLTLQGSYNCRGVQNPNVSIVPEVVLLGSCASAGYNTCCSNKSCEGSPPNCYCDANCHLYGDCCSDVSSTCLTQGYSPYVVVSERYYMRHFEINNPARSRTFLSNLNDSKAIDYHYRMNAIFWGNNNFPGIWRSNLNGSGIIPILNDSTVAKIAIDWVSDKLYWTDYALKTINVIDLHTGHRKKLFTLSTHVPVEILADPNSRYIFWTDYSSSIRQGRIVRASMDGSNGIALVTSSLVILITINYSEQTIFWFSGNKFGSVKTDGSNFTIINDEMPHHYSYDFFVSHLENGVLYYTKYGSYRVNLIYENGTFDQLNSTFLGCYGFAGSKVVSQDRQIIEGTNPCGVNNGGCSDLCLLSAINPRGYSCACHNGTSLSADGRACPVTGTVQLPPHQGTCRAAGNTGCCTSGNCRGSPPTCGCDALCVGFRDCCSDAISLCSNISIPVVPEVEVTADRTRVREGDDVTLTCSVSRGYPMNYAFTWTHVNTTNYFPSSSMSQSTASLKLLSISMEDTGIYMCSVISEAGTGMDSITIDLGVAPVVLSRVHLPNGTVLVVGSTVQLVCGFSSGDLPISLSWTGPAGAMLSEDINVNISIIINLSTSLDYGNYTCTANNSFGVATDVLTIIQAAEPVVMLDKGQSLTRHVVAGGNLTLSVSISDFNLPLTNISWIHEGNIIISGQDRDTITNPSLSPAPAMSTLQRTAVIPLDSGNYVITATNPAGSQELAFTVTVTAPVILTDPSSDVSLERDEGEMVTLSCTGSGVPQPFFIWSPANSDITEAAHRDSDGHFIVTSNLTIASITRTDAVYTCTAGSSQTRSFTFTVNYTPSIIFSPVRTVQLLSPATLSLTCSADGHPLPIISWIKTLSNGFEVVLSMTSTIENKRNFTISIDSNKTVQSTIVIEHTLAMDTANYSCVAANRLGADISTISSVSVYEVPDISFPVDSQQFFTNEQTNITFNCTASGSPAPSISFSYEGQTLNSTVGRPSSRGRLMDRVQLGSAEILMMTSTGLYIVAQTLTLFDVVDADTGNFSCSASTNIRDSETLSDTVTFGLTVFVAANITEFPVDQIVTSPDTATFSCTASGLPRPNITWSGLDGATLLSGINGTTITEDDSRGERLLVSTLDVMMTSSSSSGGYSCNAHNDVFGRGDTLTLATASLTVYVNPSITAFLPGVDVRYVVNATDGVTFQCTATGVPPPLIQWFRGDTYLNSSADLRITLSVPIISAPLRALSITMRTLTINGTTIDDAATNYSCRASNVASRGSASEVFELFVQVVPEVRVTTDHTRVREGDNVTLTCSVSRGNSMNYAFTWTHVKTTNSTSMTHLSATLNLPSFSVEDTGVYICSVMSEAGSGMDNITIDLGVAPVVLSRVDPLNGTVQVVGAKVKLVCEVSFGDLPITLSWTDPAGAILSEDINSNISIIIKLSTSLDYGNYTCTANNSFGMATDVLSIISAAPPVVMPDEGQVLTPQVLAGGNLTLSVLISDFNLPLNNVSWTHEGNIIVSGKDRSTITNPSLSPAPVMSTLQRTAVTPLSSGNYVITATNPAGSQELRFTVTVTAPTILTDPNSDVLLESDEGEIVTLSCTASGVPQPSIIWSPANSSITEAAYRDSDWFFIITSNLTIASITRTDAMYTCTANNTGSSQTRSFTFTVNYPPSIISSPVRTVQLLSPATLSLTCSADGLPLPTINWIKTLSSGSEIIFSMTSVKVNRRNFTIYTDSNLTVRSTIVIEQTIAMDTGNYSCVVANRLGADISTISSVSIYEAPDVSFPVDFQQFFSNEQTDFTSNCTASGSPAPLISFSYEGQVLNSTEGRPSSTRPLMDRVQLGSAEISMMTSTGLYSVTRTLTLFNAVDADTGNFSCSASANIRNESISDTVTYGLTVFVAANIIALPVDKIVTSPGTATFSCTATGLPRPNITWTSPDGATLVSGVNDTTITEDDRRGERLLFSTLNVMMTSSSSSGGYSCNADNGVFGRREKLTLATASLTVYVKPNITAFLPGGDVRYVVNATDGVTFQCTATGVPPPLIQWFRGDTYLNSSADLRITLSVPIISAPLRALGMAMRTLTISRTTIDDAATNYSCRASNVASGGTASEMFELFVQVVPEVQVTADHTRVREGNNVTLTCSVIRGNSMNYTYTWRHVNMTNSLSSTSMTQSSATLSLHSFSAEDTGIYMCSVMSKAGTGMDNITINLGVIPVVLSRVEPLNGTVLVVGSTVQLVCEVSSGDLPISLSWTDPAGTVLSEDINRTISTIINLSTSLNYGNYTCTANNSFGVATDMLNVVQADPPVVMPDKGQVLTQQVLAGGNLTLSVLISNFNLPLNNVSWTHEGNTIVSGKDRSTITNPLLSPAPVMSTLQRTAVIPLDSGYYVITATNPAGSQELRFTVTVTAPTILTDPNSDVLLVSDAGEMVRLSCTASGVPQPSIIWSPAISVTEAAHRDSDGFFIVTSNLTISSIKRAHAMYTCTANNTGSSQTRSFTFTVNFVPEVQVTADHTRVREGDNVTLTCSVSRGYPVNYTFIWTHVNTSDSLSSTSMTQSSATLNLQSFSAEDTGIYICSVMSEAGTGMDNITINLGVVPVLFSRVNPPIGPALVVGSTVQIVCEVSSGKLPLSLSWTAPSGALISGVINGSISITTSVTFSTSLDYGNYTCTANSSFGVVTDLLNIIEAVRPNVMQAGGQVLYLQLVTGDDMNLSVLISDFNLPLNNVSWTHEGNIITSGKDRSTISNPSLSPAPVMSTLQRTAVIPLDSGNYVITATNPAGNQELRFTVIVTAPAIMIDLSDDLSLESDVGEMVSLSCTARGVPQPSIIWSPANSGITESVHTDSDGFFIVTSNLTIASTMRTDAGMYTCITNNTWSQQAQNFTVTVNFPSSFSASPVRTVQLLSPATLYLTCSADGLPLPTISWIRTFSDDSESVISMTSTAESGRNITISTNSSNSVESTIMIGSTRALDTANYSCVATNRLGTSNSTAYSVTIFEAPDVSFPVNSQQFFTNEQINITFTCMASGSPAPYISFSYEGQILNSTEGGPSSRGPLIDRVQLGSAEISLMTSTGLYIVTRTLTLFNTVDADTGNFSCSASANIKDNGPKSDTIYFSLTVFVAANITELPVDQSVTSSDTATFSCTASGHPRPNITWINPDGATLVSGVNDTAITEYDSRGERVLVSILNLMMTSLSSSGEYSCNADNGVFGHGDSLTSASMNLTVYVNPNITAFLPGGDVRYVVNATDGVTFQCTASGVPPPLIQWFKGDIYLNSSADLRITLNVPIISAPVRALGMAMRTLTINWTTIDDAATNYSCRASNVASGGTASEMFDLFVQVPPVVVPLSQNQRVTANKGHSAILRFQIDNAVPAVQTSGLRWYYTSNASSGTLKFSSTDFQEITNLMNRTSTSMLTFSNGSLTLKISSIVQAIGDVMETDQGRYFLVATNAAGERSNYTDLVINGSPQIVGGPQDVFVISDGSSAAVFSCEAIAFPDHNVSWSYTNSTGHTFDPIITTDDTNRYLIYMDHDGTGFGRLTLNNVTYKDRGTYTCTAINSVGMVSSSGHLTVHVIPILLNISHPTATLLSQSVAIFCQASGFPIPTITWQKNGTDITTTNASRLDVFSFSPLLIPISNGTNDFEGNGFKGSISELIRMNGLDVKTFISSDELKVVGVLYFKSVAQDDTDTYTCTATNGFPLTTTIMSVSDMVHLIVLERLGTPINVTATAAGPLSISLAWTSVFVGNSSVTNFIIYIRNVNTSSDFVQVATRSVSDVTIIMEGSYMITVSDRNLVLPFTRYSFRVASCNMIGCSNQSQESEPIQTNQDLSSPPRDVSVTETTTSTLTVVGILPLTSNGIITQYRVNYTGSKDYDISFSDTNSVSFNLIEAGRTSDDMWHVVLLDLTPGTTYNIIVAAVNGAVRNNGVGTPSSPATGNTGSLPPPPPPQPPTLLADPLSSDLRTYTLQLTNFSEINGRISHFHIVVVILPQGQSIGDLQQHPDGQYKSIKDLDVYSEMFCKQQPTTPKAYITSEFGRDLLPMDGFVIGMDTSGNNSPNDRQSIYGNGHLCYGFKYTFFIRAYPVINSKSTGRSIRQTGTRQYTMFTSTNYYTSTTIDTLFQLRIQISLACSSWINDRPTDKAEDVVDGVLRELTRRCQCDLATDTTITDAGFLCFPESPQHITFRARIHGTMKVSASELISHLELWLMSGATISVMAQLLNLEAVCPVAISSTSEAECRSDNGDTPSGFTNVSTTLTGGIFGVILLGLLVVGIVVIVVLLRRRSAGRVLKKNSTSIIQNSQTIQLNSLIDNQGNCTNPPHTYEECHEYEYIDVVIKEAETLRASVRDSTFSQCEAHRANKKSDFTNTSLCYKENCEYDYDDFIKEKDKESGIVGQSAAMNAYSQCAVSGVNEKKEETVEEEDYYTEMETLERHE